MEFDFLGPKAEARMSMGPGFPGEFASVLCMQNASLTKNERQLVIASVGSSLTFARVSAQMRRLLGNIGSSQNMDALAAQEMDNVSDEENFETWAAYRKAKRAKKNSSDGGSRDSVPKKRKGKIKNAAN